LDEAGGGSSPKVAPAGAKVSRKRVATAAVIPLAASGSKGRPEGKRAASHRPEEKSAVPPREADHACCTPARSKAHVNKGVQGGTTMRMIGLDLGARKICFAEARGEDIVARATVRSLGELMPLLGPNTPKARVVIEACREAWHVHDKLTEWGHEVWILDTTRTSQVGIGAHGKKTDRIDAGKLALANAANQVPRAHVLSPHRRQLRDQINIRRALVKVRSELSSTIRGIVRARGIKLGGCKPEVLPDKLRRTQLPEEVRAIIEPLMQTLATSNAQVVQAERVLEQVCAKEIAIPLLATIKGVSLVVAASFVSVIDEAGRFNHAHQVEAYLGLVPREDTTGGKRKLGSITKQGNTYLRSVLVQAAWSIRRTADPNDPLKIWLESVEKRRGKRVAIIALARRLAGIMWAMWRDGTVYDPGALGSEQARGLKAQAQNTLQQARATAAAARKLALRTRPRSTEVAAIG
jgi:transposase